MVHKLSFFRNWYKKETDAAPKPAEGENMIILMILTSVLIAIVGQILLKHGIGLIDSFSKIGLLPFFKTALFSPWVLSGLFLYGVGTLIWLLVLSKVEVSYAYPMLSLGYILLLAFSYFFLHEQVPPIRIIGVLLIVVGVILVMRS